MEQLSQEQIDILLSGMWQNHVFRNYLVKRDRDITIAIKEAFLKDTNGVEGYRLYGRHQELMDLHNITKFAFERREKFMKERKTSSQAKT
jgi:hypothetical protein